MVRVVTDSTSYVPRKLREELGILVVSLNVSFETEAFREEEIDNIKFYERMAQSEKLPTSSPPAPFDFYDVYESIVAKGDSVVGIFISSEMSKTYSAALMAKSMILSNYPDAVIEIIDSRYNCMAMGLGVVAAARAAREGKSAEEVIEAAHRVMKRMRFLFVPLTLDYLKKGGRIGGAAALLGQIFQIRPVLTIVDGKIAVHGKVRTQTKALQNIVDDLIKDAGKKGVGEVVVHHINCKAEGYNLAQSIEDRVSAKPFVVSIGPVIGLHVGPGTVGIAYYTDRD
ncbi:MAG: DegV family protein [Bacillota bacterium]